MKRTILIVAMLAFAWLSGFSQASMHGDVAVIVNDSSASSVAIGNYFAMQRGISPNRILHITAPTSVTIDSTQFQDMRGQIEAALITGNLLDTVNYLVTTRGMPARVSVRNSCDTLAHTLSPSAIGRCTSTESELSLILGPLAGDILGNLNANNPYLQAQAPFDRDSFGIFLVSRLDGYSDAAAMSLIDHGGADIAIQPQDVEIVLDYSGANMNSSLAMFLNQNNQINEAHLLSLGYPVVNDTARLVVVQNQTNVIGYVAGHYQDSLATLNPNLSFHPGAIVSLWSDELPIGSHVNSKFQAGDAIEAGAGVVVSHVSPFFAGPSFHPEVGLPLYLDTVAGPRYNAAESVFYATAALSAQHVLLGDPKTSVSPSMLLGRHEASYLDFALYPNPTHGRFRIRLANGVGGDCQIQVSDLQGRVLMQATHRGDREIDLDVSELPAGLYLVRMQKDGDSATRRLSVVH